MKKLICLLIMVLLTGCKKDFFDHTPYIEYTKAKYTMAAKNKTYAGYIDRGKDVNLSFALSGVIDQFFVSEGDFVKKGAILAKLDNKEYNFSISKAKTELEDATVKYNRAKSYYERISKLYKAGGISYNDWESAQTNLKTSINEIEMLKDSLNIARDKEKFTYIKAPENGYVIMTYKDNKQFSQAGDKVILFQGLNYLEARVFVSQNEINKIKKNQKVILTADAIEGKTFEGTVKSKTLTSINEGAYRVTISIRKDAKELLDGMSVNVRFLDDTENKKILLPISAVLSEADGQYIFILQKMDENGGIAKKRKIKTGMLINDEIAIEKGLLEGEFVITKGIDKIMDNSKVKIE